MAFFDDLRDKAMDFGNAAVAKSKQLAEIAKLNLANSSEEETIRKAYIEIGKLYYAEQGMAPDPAYAALCEKITASKTTIEENRSRINELKAEDEARDADAAPLMTDMPPEEPDHCGCGERHDCPEE